MLLLGTAVYLVATTVRSAAYRLEGFTVYPEVFRLADAPPEWLGSEDLAAFRSAAAAVAPFSVFESRTSRRFEEAFSDNPWFRGVAEVRPLLPDEVEVTVRVRKPIASVERAGSYTLVDRNAVRLPGRFSRAPVGFSYPVPTIVGANLGPPPRNPGELWDDQGVREGVAVALELYALYNSDLADRIAIERIDVSNVGGRRNPRQSEIVLWTNDGVAIHWGRSRLYQGYGENPTSVKLDLLRIIERERPGLRGLESASVLFDDPVVKPAVAGDAVVPGGGGPGGER